MISCESSVPYGLVASSSSSVSIASSSLLLDGLFLVNIQSPLLGSHLRRCFARDLSDRGRPLHLENQGVLTIQSLHIKVLEPKSSISLSVLLDHKSPIKPLRGL